MSEPSPRRRDFLNPVKAIRAFRDEATESRSEMTQTDIDDIADDCLLFVSRQAMACTFQIYFSPSNGDATAEVAIESLDLLEQLEDQMTVYRSSPMTYLNEMAAKEVTRVESRLYSLLKMGRELYENTGGAFDMTAGILTKTWGFFRKRGRVPADDELSEILKSVGTDQITFDDVDQSVLFNDPGLEINLGGIGKGFALDCVGESMRASGIDNFLIHGGQSSVLAHGQRYSDSALPTETSCWKVGLRHPLRNEHRLAELFLKDRAIGTSGTGRQSFYHKGKRYGHIIDPRSGQPAEGVFSATAVAPTAAEADALATAFYIMGGEAAIAFCEKYPQYAALVISPKRGNEIQIHSAGFSQDELKLL